MDILKQFSIPVTGLKAGEHHYDLEAGDSFFEHFGNPEIKKGKVALHVTLTKRPNMMVLEVDLKGTVNTTCDRCGALFDLPVEGEGKLIVKFGEELEDFKETDEVKVLRAEDPDIRLAQDVYEWIMISVPQKRVHDEGECDPDSIEKLKALERKEEETEKDSDEAVDPRWEALRKLKNSSRSNQ